MTSNLRNTKLYKANQLALRDKLKAGEYIKQIDEVSTTLQAQWQSLDRDQLSGLKLIADINFKRLNKVLPDLKSIEVNATVDHTSKHETLLNQLDKHHNAIDGELLE